jgi:putative membrane protein
VFTSLALASATAVHWVGPGFALWPIFIIGHIFWLLFIIAIIVFAVAGRRRRMARWGAMGGGFGPWAGHWDAAARGAESTLAERFAQGDIDEKEYRARLEVLRANNGSRGPAA